jgi:hypothetical protein
MRVLVDVLGTDTSVALPYALGELRINHTTVPGEARLPTAIFTRLALGDLMVDP